MTVGSSGYGYVMFAPCVANDIACAYYTHSSSFAGTSTAISIDSATPHVLAINMTNAPYSYASFTDTSGYNRPALSGRVVSAAISLEYIGKEVDRGGNVVCFVDPDHDPVSNLDFTAIISRREAEISVPGPRRDKCWISTCGLKDEELDYPDANTNASGVNAAGLAILQNCYPFSGNAPLKEHYDPGTTTGFGFDDQRGAPVMIAFVSGGASGTTYRFKIVQHLEYVGAAADTYSTPNHTDSRSFELVQSAASLMYSKKVVKPHVPLGSIMKECLVEAAALATSNVAMAAGQALLASAL